MSAPIEGWTWEDLAGKIDSEGFDYYFSFYESPESFTDEKLRALAEAYVAAAKALREYLEKNGGLL